MIIAGPVADWLGVQSWFRVAGIACIAMGAVGFFIPAIVHVEDRK